jgi:hypothetical protein
MSVPLPLGPAPLPLDEVLTVVLAVDLAINQGGWSEAFKAGANAACEEIAYRLQHPDCPYPTALGAGNQSE